MPTITLTITLTVPEGTNFEVKTDTQEEATIEVVETPAIQEAEKLPVFHGEHGDAPAHAKNWVGWWSEAEDELARDMSIPDAELAECVGRSADAVHAYRYQHGYSEPSRHRVLVPARRSMARWTDVEVVELFRLVGIHGDEAWDYIGQRLGRSAAAVKRQYDRSLVIA